MKTTIPTNNKYELDNTVSSLMRIYISDVPNIKVLMNLSSEIYSCMITSIAAVSLFSGFCFLGYSCQGKVGIGKIIKQSIPSAIVYNWCHQYLTSMSS